MDREERSWRYNLRTSDHDELAEAQPQWALRYEQLSCGSFVGEVTHIQLPGVRVVLESSSCALHQCGEMGKGQVGFAMMIDQPGDATFNGLRLTPESMMIGPSDKLDLSSPANYSVMAVVVERGLLAALWESMYQKPLSTWLDQQVVVKVAPPAIGALRSLHLDLLSQIAANQQLVEDPQVMRQMRDTILLEWMAAIPDRVELTGLKSAAARKRVVDRACEAMLALPEQPKTILEVCSLIGASPRKLEYCFRDVLGISPVKYSRALRLNGARRDLKRNTDPHPSVQDVAARWGFWHLSDFSGAFKCKFGELPSETLRRAARR